LVDIYGRFDDLSTPNVTAAGRGRIATARITSAHSFPRSSRRCGTAETAGKPVLMAPLIQQSKPGLLASVSACLDSG